MIFFRDANFTSEGFKLQENNLSYFLNPFHATGLFLHPLKTSENLWFSDVFRGYGKRPATGNGLKYLISYQMLLTVVVHENAEGDLKRRKHTDNLLI